MAHLEKNFERQFLGSFRQYEASSSKGEITDIINMMFRFFTRTGSIFKIEEYLENIIILTETSKLLSSDVSFFIKKNRIISKKIFFSDLPKNKEIYNIYEDCFKNRSITRSPYEPSYSIFDIRDRSNSVSFILDS